MNKIAMLFSMLAAVLLLSALPAVSGSGPYGSFGPSDNFVMGQGVETHHNVVAGATGPYGAFGPTYKGVDTPRTAVAGGSGPYGAFNSSGLIEGVASHQIANKDDCMLVAKNCPSDKTK